MVKQGASIGFGIAALTLALACAPEPRCEPVRRCDVRKETCQQTVLRHAACLRGEPVPEALSFSVRVMSRSDYIAQAAEEAAEQSEEQALMRRGLALFGFLRDDHAAQAAEDRALLVGAYYDPDTRTITLLEDGRRSRGQNVVMLVHEMVHALQDAAGQLAHEQPLRHLDQTLAYRALVEGEATILTDESAINGYGFPFDELDYSRALASYRRSAVASARSDDYPFATASMRFPYAFGASYLWSLRRREGIGAVASAFAEPPVSTSAVMLRRPEDRPNDLGRSAVPVLSEHSHLSEFTLVGSYHLGRFLYRVALDRDEGPIPNSLLPGADHFVADTFSVFSAGDERLLAFYRVRFDDEAVLDELARSLEAREFAHWMGVEGRDLWWAEAEGNWPPQPSELRWDAAPDSDFGFADEAASMRQLRCPHATPSSD